jgi:hypothetical protein
LPIETIRDVSCRFNDDIGTRNIGVVPFDQDATASPLPAVAQNAAAGVSRRSQRLPKPFVFPAPNAFSAGCSKPQRRWRKPKVVMQRYRIRAALPARNTR